MQQLIFIVLSGATLYEYRGKYGVFKNTNGIEELIVCILL